RMDLPLGIPAIYWQYLREYQPVMEASQMKQPLLILQGERDYQVTMEDFAGWKKALHGRPNVTMKSYPDLNHFFMEGKGKSRPEEYQRAGHVAEKVIVDIVKWIKSQ
ncbi:MAG: dienelactone hydrolase family protein, partial [Gemmataceae bacterium]